MVRRLPVDSEVLEASQRHDSSPRRADRFGPATLQQLLQAICGWAAPRLMNRRAVPPTAVGLRRVL
jgi:hypothetical protein